VVGSGCPSAHREKAAPTPTHPEVATPTATHSATASPAPAPAAHDPAHPPIDCPLRQQGIDPHQLRPFADTAKYIAFLDRPDRAAWQKPDAVVAALGLKGTETIADVGAGSGYFSFRLARAVPQGQVVALDVEPEMIRHLHHRAMTEGVRNLHATFAKPDDPGVPPDTDLVFLCDVLHHVPQRPAWLAKLAASLKPGARLALLEFREGKLPEGPPEAMKLSRTTILDLVTKAGFVLEHDHSARLPYQNFLIFRKPR
jgi:SAM-dependent methyltransferase